MESEQEQRQDERGQAAATVEPNVDDDGRAPLFADDELTDFRSRWDAIQAGFVDEPRAAVESADALVSDLVERLTAGFSDARSRLEGSWEHGGEGSTEELRLALKRYRSFFNRLLEV
jgi:hypothetical protein